jgi:Predicted membrane protein (DUF2142)
MSTFPLPSPAPDGVTPPAQREHRSPSGDASLPFWRRRTWTLAFAGFFLLFGAWAIAAPYNGTPDEREHLIRAVSVDLGQVFPKPAAWNEMFSDVRVPSSVNRYRCWQFVSTVDATCQPEPGGDTTMIDTVTTAGRYHPVYYAIVGWPMVLFPNWAGILLARLVSAAMCAAMLAIAMNNALRWSRGRIAAAGVLVATTPMVAHLGGALNPNGLEIAAGAVLFAAGVPLVSALRRIQEEDDPPSRTIGRHHRHDPLPSAYPRLTPLLTQIGLAACCMALLRFAGPLWLLLSVVALLMPLNWRLVRRLWAWHAVRWWTLAIGGVVGAAVTWTLVFEATFLGDYTGGNRLRPFQAVWEVTLRWPSYLNEMIGVMSWLDTPLPSPVYVIWEAIAAAVIILGALMANREGRWRLGAIAVAGVIIPTGLMLSVINTAGFFTQGRYLLPVLVGLPIVAGYLIDERSPLESTASPGLSTVRSAVRSTAVVLLALHLGSLAWTMVRWQRGMVPTPGLRDLNPFTGAWHPPLGSVLPLLTATASAALLGYLLWKAADTPVSDPLTEHGMATPEETNDLSRLAPAQEATSARREEAEPVPQSPGVPASAPVVG